MADNSLGPRLSNKLKLACHKTPIQNVIIDWLVNGSVDEKNDADTIISNAEDALNIVNGLNHQINPDFNVKNFFKRINNDLSELLSQNPEFSTKATRNRKNIEIRGWILTIYAQTCSEANYKEVLNRLHKFLEPECDRKVTIYWSIIAVLYCLDIMKETDKLAFVDDQFKKCLETLKKKDIIKDRIYWLLVIWYVNYYNNKIKDYEQKKSLKETSIKTLDEYNKVKYLRDKQYKKIETILQTKQCNLTPEIIDTITELFAALSCKPCCQAIKPIQLFVDDVIDKDLNKFWEEKDIHMYKYLVLCLRNFGKKEWKGTLGDLQINLYYKIIKLLTITRSYSSRIWNEIKLQLLKSIRAYNRTTGKKIIDELREEILHTDIGVVFEACKTLKSVFDIDSSLQIIIEVLNDESIKNITFPEQKIFAVAYSLKILSLKETNLVNVLQELEQKYNDYNKKTIIRKLFTEMGGMAAIRKSQQNADIREKYMQITSKAQEKVETMFHKSINDAKKAFKVSLYMNIVVFFVGISLLASSGIIAISNEDQDNWAGVGLSSGTGFLSVVYSLFINKPSRKIRKNTNHLMRLKVIFLGYLRELTQMDQSFSKNLLDQDNISQKELQSYVTKIKNSMNNSLEALRWEELLNNTTDDEMRKRLFEDGFKPDLIQEPDLESGLDTMKQHTKKKKDGDEKGTPDASGDGGKSGATGNGDKSGIKSDSDKPGATDAETSNYNKLRKEFFDEISRIKKNIHIDIKTPTTTGAQKQSSQSTSL